MLEWPRPKSFLKTWIITCTNICLLLMLPCTSMHVIIWLGRNIIQQCCRVVLPLAFHPNSADCANKPGSLINLITNCVSVKGRLRTFNVVINKYRANKAAVRPAVLNKNEIRFFSLSLLSSTEQVAFFLVHLRQLIILNLPCFWSLGWQYGTTCRTS